ncbi:MAG: zinc ribbon domain-containing protein [Chloroflexi bacterium]|nr:MAG: zinc ribbon domain-containing protein [Chloroflexota bacterium]
MDIGSILLILSLLVLVALYLARPLVVGTGTRSVPNDTEDHEISSLLAERDRIILALQELDFDHAMGKIPEEDYPAQRASLLQRGAETLRQLDIYLPSEKTTGSTVEDRIEAAIAARRSRLVPAYSGSNGSSTIEDAEDDLEVAIANRRRMREEKAAGFCPQCGKAIQTNDHFCPKCGTKL